MSQIGEPGYPQKPRSLSFEAAISICEKLTPSCQKYRKIADELEAQGFAAFRPRFEFASSYCESDEERLFFEHCEVERAKERVLSTARVTPYFGPPMDTDYTEPSSLILNELRRKRDQENGCRSQDLERHYSFEEARWRREYDPILRRIAQLPPNVTESCQAEVQKREWSLFEEELTFHKDEMINTGGRTRSKLCRLFLDVAGQRLKDFDFSLIKSKSPRHFPTLTKQLNEFWDLRFAPRWTKYWKYSPFEPRSSRPWSRFCEFELLICHGHLHEQVSDYAVPSDNILQLRYDFIVPRFALAYQTFFGPDDLELDILAHTALLGLVLPELEYGLMSEEFLINPGP